MKLGFERKLVFPGNLGNGTIFLKLGFERMLVFPRNSRMDILGAAENPTFYRAQLKMNPRVTPRFLEMGF